MGIVESRAEDSGLIKDERVWIAYSAVKPKVTAKLSEMALVNPNPGLPRNSEANGANETMTLKNATTPLSNLAIRNARLVNYGRLAILCLGGHVQTRPTTSVPAHQLTNGKSFRGSMSC